MGLNQYAKLNGYCLGQLTIILFVMCSSTSIINAGSVTDNQLSHVGVLGDRINFRTGELTLGSVDVTLPGRHGQNLSISHNYSSQMYDPATVDSAFQHYEYTNVGDSSLYNYLGYGWHIEFPYLRRHDGQDIIVYQNGVKERYFSNVDTLTNTDWPFKTNGFAILTGIDTTTNSVDSMLLNGGTKWIFGHQVKPDSATDLKFLTQIVNRFGDSTTIEYHAGSRWIKRVTSAIGLWVDFEYSDGAAISYDYDSIPPANARLRRISYLNHNGDTLDIKYFYRQSSSMRGRILNKIIYPSGDSTKYTYSNTVYYNDIEDNYFEAPNPLADTLQYNDTTTSYSSGNMLLLSTINERGGASTKFLYRYVNLPIYQPCFTNGTLWQDDAQWDYSGHIAVNKRISDGDTLLFKYEICRGNLNAAWVREPHTTTSRTTMYPLTGGFTEYWFFMELGCQFGRNGSNILSHNLTSGGFYPGAIYQLQSVLDGDTTATGFDYGVSQYVPSIQEVGVQSDTIWAFSEACQCDTVVSIIKTDIFQPFLRSQHNGVAWYHPQNDSAGLPGATIFDSWKSTSQWPISSSFDQLDLLANGLNIFSISGERESQNFGIDVGYEWSPWDSSGTYLWPGMNSSPALWDGDTATTGDTLSFVKDSVESWEFVPSLNISVIKKVKHTVQRDSTIIVSFDERIYDPVTYLLDSTKFYFDTLYTKIYDTALVINIYDTAYNVTRQIKGTRNFQDTVDFVFDTVFNAFLWKTVDPSTGYFRAKEYYPNGQLKKRIGINGDTTELYYDYLGRDSVRILPLETEYSRRTLYNYGDDSSFVERSIKIKDSLFTTTRVFLDKYNRRAKTWHKTGDTYDIIDSTQYDSVGNVVLRSKKRWDDGIQSQFRYTGFLYDQHRRLTKSIFIGLPGDTLQTTITYLDSFAVETTNPRGLTTKTKFDGNHQLDSVIQFDASGDTIGVITSEYDRFGNLNKVTDISGKSRTFEYDQYQRIKSLTNPDVGTSRFFYNSRGQVRFVRKNTDNTYTYFKYDSEQRLIEEGTKSWVVSDTLYVDSSNFPDTLFTIQASYRYDSYSNDTSATDTANGLSFYKGRLTEITDNSGFTWFYYDARGRVRKRSVYINGLADTLKYVYDYFANNSVHRIIYPDGDTITYDYDEAGRLDGIAGIIDTGSIQYQPSGQIASINYVNGIKTINNYDSFDRLSKTLNWSDSTFGFYNFFSRGYTYDNHYVSEEWDLDTLGVPTTLGKIRDYTYDRFDRLDSAYLKDANNIAPDRAVGYDYDLSNNLNYRSISGVSGLDTVFYFRDTIKNNNRITSISYNTGSINDSTHNIFWNSAGNVSNIFKTGTGRIDYAYDYRELQTAMAVEDFSEVDSYLHKDSIINVYNSAGRKVKQIYISDYYQISGGMNMSSGSGGGTSFLNPLGIDSSSSGTQSASGGGGIGPPGGGGGTGSWVKDTTIVYYDWSGNSVVWEHHGNDNTAGYTFHNIYGLGKHLARKNRSANGPDSVLTLISDYLGNVRSTVKTNGEPIDKLIEYYPYGQEYSVNGVGAVPFGFIGKETDKTGNQDFGPRYYSDNFAQFLQPDPILSGPSAYSYAGGNPIMFNDPSGLKLAPGVLTTSQQHEYDLAVGAAIANAERRAEAEAAYYVLQSERRAGGSLIITSHTGIGDYGLPGDIGGASRIESPFAGYVPEVTIPEPVEDPEDEIFEDEVIEVKSKGQDGKTDPVDPVTDEVLREWFDEFAANPDQGVEFADYDLYMFNWYMGVGGGIGVAIDDNEDLYFVFEGGFGVSNPGPSVTVSVGEISPEGFTLGTETSIFIGYGVSGTPQPQPGGSPNHNFTGMVGFNVNAHGSYGIKLMNISNDKPFRMPTFRGGGGL